MGLLKQKIMKKIKIPFEYNGFHYVAVIRVRKNPGAREFHITVLNWELERLLYSNQVIQEVDGVLQPIVFPPTISSTTMASGIQTWCRSTIAEPVRP